MNVTSRAVPLAALALWACGDSPSSPASSGLQLIAGAAYVDTVDAEPAGALAVRVRDESGQPLAGAVVRFESLLVIEQVDGQIGTVPTALVAQADGGFETIAFVPTDGAGEAAVRVKLGALAGSGGIVVSVPALSVRDTAHYAIEPGAAIDFIISPGDTAVYVGATIDLQAGRIDRHGNMYSDPVSFNTQSAAVDVTGASVVAMDYGLAEIVATAATGSATSRISVVPHGTIAAFYHSDGRDRGIVVFGLDGSMRHQLTMASAIAEQVPYWSPAGDRIVFHSGATIAHLFTMTIDGSPLPVPGAASIALQAEKWAQFSRDGRWIYYSGYQGNFTWSLWRVHADGSGGAERIGPFAVNTQTDAAPSPSPAGDSVVFWTNRYGGQRLALLDVETGAFEPITASGSTARWSPAGDRIAYIDAGAIRLVDANGGDPRMLAPSGFEEWVDWSPDGEWLVAADDSNLWVIRIADGLMLPVPHAEDMLYPSWRPGID